jgi:hypothetical protein
MLSWGGCRMGALCDLVAGKMMGFIYNAFYKGYCGQFLRLHAVKTPHRTHGF